MLYRLQQIYPQQNKLPDGVEDRNEAISQRIKSAGIKRKITPDQVRAICVMLSRTHEDMMKIQESGRIDEWCNDNLKWLYKFFGMMCKSFKTKSRKHKNSWYKRKEKYKLIS